MRTPLIAANWKMHKTVPEAVSFLRSFVPAVKDVSGVEIVIAPVFTALKPASELLAGSGVLLSAQNVFYETEGAYTGEISPSMLTDVGCTYVIVGHSERRQYFGETDETVNKRMGAALAAGLKVIFCIGETLEQREANETNDVLKTQLEGGLRNLSLADIVVAYEPVWAIGTGVTATPEQAEDAHRFIRTHLGQLYGQDKAEAVRILYGGSVKPENVKTLMNCENIDGALVGGASLKPESFEKLVRFKEQ
jgi:triosephosphate isomerase